MQVFGPDDLEYLHGLPEVAATRGKSGVVSFQVDSNESIRATLQTYGINAGPKVPMRWIEGDTKEHIDRGHDDFEKTFLVYLEGSGSFILGTETHSIAENKGFLFNEGVLHRTDGASKRLILGPMNEFGQEVGSPLQFGVISVGTTKIDAQFFANNYNDDQFVFFCSATDNSVDPKFVIGVDASPSNDSPSLVCSFTGLTSNTGYEISAYERNITEGYVTAEITTFASTLPLPFTFGPIDVFQRSINANFVPTENPSDTYICSATDGDNFFDVVPADNDNYKVCEFTGLSPDLSYTVSVFANPDGMGTFNEIQTTINTPSDTPPTFVDIVPGFNFFSVTFAPSTDPSDTYVCSATFGPEGVGVGVGVDPVDIDENKLCFLDGLTPETTYYVTVYNTNDPSESIESITSTLAPTLFAFTFVEPNSTAIAVQFTTPGTALGCSATNVISDFGVNPTYDGYEYVCIFLGLETETTYEINVFSNDAFGSLESITSITATLESAPPVPPVAPDAAGFMNYIEYPELGAGDEDFCKVVDSSGEPVQGQFLQFFYQSNPTSWSYYDSFLRNLLSQSAFISKFHTAQFRQLDAALYHLYTETGAPGKLENFGTTAEWNNVLSNTMFMMANINTRINLLNQGISAVFQSTNVFSESTYTMNYLANAFWPQGETWQGANLPTTLSTDPLQFANDTFVGDASLIGYNYALLDYVTDQTATSIESNVILFNQLLPANYESATSIYFTNRIPLESTLLSFTVYDDNSNPLLITGRVFLNKVDITNQIIDGTLQTGDISIFGINASWTLAFTLLNESDTVSNFLNNQQLYLAGPP